MSTPPSPGGPCIAVDSKIYRQKLEHAFYHQGCSEGIESTPPAKAVADVIRAMESKAEFAPDILGTHKVWLRIAPIRNAEGKVVGMYQDLGPRSSQTINDGRYAKVSAGKVDLTDTLPDDVFIERLPGQHPHPDPDLTGTLSDVFAGTSFATPSDHALALTSILNAFHPTGPYMVTTIEGPAGSGKTTLTRRIVQLSDPRDSLVKNNIGTPKDLIAHACNHGVLAFDNDPVLSKGLSSMVCSLSTGASFGSKKNYTDVGEASFELCRPIVFNGITSIAERVDLLSRTNTIRLRALPHGKNESDQSVKARQESSRAKALGGILCAYAEAFRHPDHKPEFLPRMADVAIIVDAARAAWPSGVPTYLEAIRQQEIDRLQERYESSVVLRMFVEEAQRQDAVSTTGSMTDWHTRLAPEGKSDWPKNPRALQEELKRLTPVLRSYGISFEREIRADGQAKLDSGRRTTLYRLSYDSGTDETLKVEEANPAD